MSRFQVCWTWCHFSMNYRAGGILSAAMVFVETISYSLLESHRSASKAAMQPVPAAVTA
jgi:hypothetical protein